MAEESVINLLLSFQQTEFPETSCPNMGLIFISFTVFSTKWCEETLEQPTIQEAPPDGLKASMTPRLQAIADMQWTVISHDEQTGIYLKLTVREATVFRVKGNQF